MFRLHELRSKNKISQQKLADSLGVSRSAVSMWEIESSQPDNQTLCQIASLFDVSIDYLLGCTDNPNSSNMLGAYVRFRRGQHSREEFAEQIKMNPILLADIEQGFKGSKDWANKAKRQASVGWDDLDTLAKGLNVDVNYLACLASNVNPYKVENSNPPADDIFIMLKPTPEDEKQNAPNPQFNIVPTNLHHFGVSDPLIGELHAAYEKLNADGRQRILNYAKDLVQISSYTDELQTAAKVAGDVTHALSDQAKDEIKALDDVTEKL